MSVCEWRGEFNRVVLVVQLGLIFHFFLNPEQRRVFQLVYNKNNKKFWKELIRLLSLHNLIILHQLHYITAVNYVPS
jgi:hypothetical protein